MLRILLMFGHVSRQIEGISSVQELRKLGRKVLRARSLEDMGIG
jgi:hypothetical protein